MGETFYNLAFDFGASSGRMVLCKLEDGKLELEELHRFRIRRCGSGGTFTGICSGFIMR